MHDINDIAKALNICTADYLSRSCDSCPYRTDRRRCGCIAALHKDALHWIAQSLHMFTKEQNDVIENEDRANSFRLQALFGRRYERSEPATPKQLAYIRLIRQKAPRTTPPFDGTTKQEASDYIDRYKFTDN